MANDGLLPELDKEIAFQDKWADIMSWSYTSMSALAVIASGAATVVAALGHSTLWCYFGRSRNSYLRSRKGSDAAREVGT